MDLSLRLLADAQGAQGAFKDFGAAVTAAGALVAGFAKDSIKAFAESERAQKQLARAAGENTAAFTVMAETLSRQLGVDDEHIKKLETLALNYGTLPQHVEGATKAVLDYAAATGRDATQAMQQLINGVENGTGSLGRMGVSFEATGDKAKDMELAIAALNAKFAGAAATDADTLEGRMRKADVAMGELKESFGGLFATLEAKTGLVDKLAVSFANLAAVVNKKGAGGGLQYALGMRGGFDSEEGYWRAKLGAAADTEAGQDILRRARMADEQGRGLTDYLKSVGAIPGQSDPTVKPGAVPTSEVSAGPISMVSQGKIAGGKARKDAWGWGPFGNPEESYDGWLNEYREAHAKQMEELENDRLEARRRDDEFKKKELEEEEKHDEKMLEMKRKEADLEIDLMTKHQADLDQKFRQQEEQWRRAGDSMGAALVNAIGDQLLRLAEGGDVDPAAMAGDIAATILGIAGAAIGTYFGAPQLGAAIGGFAGGIAKTGIVAGFGRKKHDGGWIERFHSGGWPMGSDEVPAILQTGERVLSRREVGAMGGPAGVDAAARGRGGNVYNISALDSQSFMDSMGDRGGRGFFDAIRVGRGDLAPLFS